MPLKNQIEFVDSFTLQALPNRVVGGRALIWWHPVYACSLSQELGRSQVLSAMPSIVD